MEKIIFINACIRKEQSRTQFIADKIIENLSKKYIIEEIDLTNINLLPINTKTCDERSNGIRDKKSVEYAKIFASADRIVISAPFWDMSFPSILKVFFEHISLDGITFQGNPDGSTHGICNAKKMMLITTRGMLIHDETELDQGSSYMKALCWLWGIPEFYVLSAIGMDLVDDKERENLLWQAIEKGYILCENF